MIDNTKFSDKFLMVSACVWMFALVGCADYGQKKEWDAIDYSKVRGREKYENDSSYSLPSVYGCTSDDLYNCN